MKTKKYILAFSLLIQSLFLGNLLYSQIDGKVRSKLDTYLSVQEQRIGFNGTVLIADKGNILYQKASGHASHELRVPMEMDAKFKIASISKSFTGMLLAQAEREGKLALDDTLKNYFSDRSISPEWEKLTLQQLFAHTSGIPHWKGYDDYWPVKSRIPLGSEQILTDIFNMELINMEKGKAHYSSPAYYLLATVLEKVYGKSYADMLREKITGPLEMESTGVYDGIGMVPKMASGYHILANDSLIVAPHRDMATMKGGGDLYSNAYDLLKWNRGLMGNGTWERSLLERYLTPFSETKLPQGGNAAYAAGLYIHPKNGQRPLAYRTAGGTFGFSSISVIYPEEGITLIVLANVSFLPVEEIWGDLEKILFKRPFELPEIVRENEISKKELGAYPGTYVAGNGMELKVAIHDHGLYAKLGSNPPLKLSYNKDHRFTASKLDIGFEFTESGNGTIDGVIAAGRGQVHEFKRQ